MRGDHTVQFKHPTQCRYWHEPKLLQSDPLRDRFELLTTYVKDDQFWQYLLRCRECGQLYFMEFRESTDWVNSCDPQFTTYVPVDNIEDGAVVREHTCKNVVPRLHIDNPGGGKEPSPYWVANESANTS